LWRRRLTPAALVSDCSPPASALAPVGYGSAVEQDRPNALFPCMFHAYKRYKLREARIFGAARADRGLPGRFRALPVRQRDLVCHGRNHRLRTMFTGQ